jgi:cytochrome c oxidase subunit 4
MADEQKSPLTDQKTGEPVSPTPSYPPGEAERMPEPENPLEEAVVEAVDASEAAVSSPVVQAFDNAVSAVQEAVDQIPGPPTTKVDASAEHHSDTTIIMGREITVPGGIYTVVFIALGVATLIEILLAEFPRGFFTIPLMLSLALVKAVLVVMYYMHLKSDSRIFTAVLLLPVIVTLMATLYLIAVPITGY